MLAEYDWLFTDNLTNTERLYGVANPWFYVKDARGKHLFSGGFLGLDNIGVFDRSRPLPAGRLLEQADGTAWTAFYCTTVLAVAL